MAIIIERNYNLGRICNKLRWLGKLMGKLSSFGSELFEYVYLVFEFEAHGHNFDCERGVIEMFTITNHELDHYLCDDDKPIRVEFIYLLYEKCCFLLMIVID